MKHRFTKLLSILLAALMIFSSLPVTAFAADGDEELYGYEWLYTDAAGVDYIKLNEYNGNDENLVIPAEYKGKIVDSLGINFFDADQLKSITVSEGIKNIDKLWFWKSGYVDLYLPSSLVSISSEAMRGNKINNLYFSEGLRSIGHYAFQAVQFKNSNIKLPESLEYLNPSSFNKSNITSIYFGANARIGEFQYNYGDPIAYPEGEEDSDFSLFHECRSLGNITVSPQNPYLTAVDDVLYNKKMTVLYRFPSKHDDTFEKNNPVYNYVMPESVKSIAEFSFGDADIKINKLTFNGTLETIPTRAFREASINEIDWGENSSVKVIEVEAFYELDCESPLTLPRSVERIGADAFSRSTITAVDFETPSNCRVIEDGAFSNCKYVKSVFIPASVESLGTEGQSDYGAFENCTANRSIVFEDGSKAKIWPSDLFEGTFTGQLVPGKNSSVEEILCDFSGSDIQSIDFSSCPNLRYIASGAFAGCDRLISADLSNTKLFEIRTTLFNGCDNLESVKLPDSCFKIGNSAFKNCAALKEINVNNVAVIRSNSFSGCTSLNIDVSSEEKTTEDNFTYYEADDYAVITGCKQNGGNIVIPQTINGKPVTAINDEAFYNEYDNRYIYNVEIPDTVKYIGSYAFAKCRLESLDLPSALEYIGAEAFYDNRNINVDLTLPNNVKEIGDNAFTNSGITGITLNNGLRAIGDEAFSQNDITSLVIPDSVTVCGKKLVNVGSYDYEGRFLTEITFGAGCRNIEDYFQYGTYTIQKISVSEDNPYYSAENGVLYNKAKTVLLLCMEGNTNKRLVIPDTVTEICDEAFSGNRHIEYVYIPNSVKVMGDYAFQNCASLNTVEFEKGSSYERLYFTFNSCKNLENVIIPADVRIGDLYATFDDTGLTHCELPDNVNSMSYTFRSTPNLKSVKMPANLIKFGEYCFSLSGVESIVIPDNIKYLPYNSFYGCSNLSYVDMNNVSSLGWRAFAYCTSLESIDLTNIKHYTRVGNLASFYGCDNLTKFYFTKETADTDIPESGYDGNTTVETIVVGNSVTEIKDRAFADCTNLKTALIADSVTEISDTAFENCNNLNIVCKEGSYAVNYAKRNSIPYTTFVVAPIPDQEYTGKAITPELDVTAQSKELSAGSDYTAVYSDNIHVGTAKVNVIGLGDYSIFASLVKFNIVGEEPQDTAPEETVPAPPQQDAEEGNGSENEGAENQTGSAADGNQADHNAGAGNVPESAQADTNGRSDTAQSAAGNPSAGAQQGNANGTDNGSGITGQNSDTTGGASNTQNENTAGESGAANHDQQAPDLPDSGGSEETNMKWYEVILSAILSFFNKIIEFFRSLFS